MPKGKLTYRRGEIRWVKLDPTIGAEALRLSWDLVKPNFGNFQDIDVKSTMSNFKLKAGLHRLSSFTALKCMCFEDCERSRN